MIQHRFEAHLPVEALAGLLGMPEDTVLLDMAIVHRTGQVFIIGTSPTVQPDEVPPGANAPRATRTSETTTCHGSLVSHSVTWST